MSKKRKNPKETDKLTTCTIYNHCSNMSEDELNKRLKKLRDEGKILAIAMFVMIEISIHMLTKKKIVAK